MPSRLRILCVDDEPRVLEGLSLQLRRGYDVDTAVSGAAGLELLRRHTSTAVVVSDMRMPGMDGVAFLSSARQLAPDAVRMVLTGHADLGSSAAVMNEVRIFKLLTKPCPAPSLLAAVAAAAEQYCLATTARGAPAEPGGDLQAEAPTCGRPYEAYGRAFGETHAALVQADAAALGGIRARIGRLPPDTRSAALLGFADALHGRPRRSSVHFRRMDLEAAITVRQLKT